MFDPDLFIHSRARAIDASGIRRVFDLAANLQAPINLSIGQPDFDVPQAIKQAAIDAIEQGHNRYTVTQGTAPLLAKVNEQLGQQLPDWAGGLEPGGSLGTLVTSGVSGGLVLALLACVGPGDEVLIPDPYFVMYKHLVTLAGATAVPIDTYPDFQLTAARIEPHITERTKMLMFNSPSNPTGVVANEAICKELVELADKHNLLILSDEIYDEFCYEKTQHPGGPACPTPASFSDRMLLLRGFSKTWAMTGWRLGYAAGPAPIIEQMTKLQQYSFVCAPSMVQAAGVVALETDMSEYVAAYQAKRDRVVERLSEHYELTMPGGAFYAFPKVPESLGINATQFVEKAIDNNLLIIPGSVFSQRDTHFRLSYACDQQMLESGLDILCQMADG
jgi:aspartate/methionine/tyrosine aminotransferase